ncbi:hypothetical protein BOFE_10010 (plasmid) [Candidatus Borrelia fainii]|uniref:Uncharacterized protein n=1 Tax=Candidatus Borrelia fainii TaxID=2518322 RepID=A0ABM8DLQ1_9SPIR|nr:DUF244 domain-containing protein [Candidatus Borrelia fainii]BDU63461.1 hypothetical protein BOFE_10010 [Candidatus Borrelia fainii]
MDSEGKAQLLEIKFKYNLYLKSAVSKYNKTGNFLENKYFFKYYVQVQMQLLCTGLNKGNLFVIIGNEAINCVFERNDDFIREVMVNVSRLEAEVIRIANSLKSNSDIDIKNVDLDELSVIIGDFLKNGCVYKDLCDIDFKFDFLEFVKFSDFEIDGEDNWNLKECLEEISSLQSEIDRVEETTKKGHTLELSRLTKFIKDKLESQIDDLIGKFSLIEHVNYNFEGVFVPLRYD